MNLLHFTYSKVTMRADAFVYFLFIAVYNNVDAGWNSNSWVQPKTNRRTGNAGVPTKLRIQTLHGRVAAEISANLYYMNSAVRKLKSDIHSMMAYIPEIHVFEQLLEECEATELIATTPTPIATTTQAVPIYPRRPSGGNGKWYFFVHARPAGNHQRHHHRHRAHELQQGSNIALKRLNLKPNQNFEY